MSLERIRQASKMTIGSNQTIKVLQQRVARSVYVAHDAEERVTQPIVELARKHSVPLTWVTSMKELGKACGIDVGAAAAAIVEE
ncbi:ribosomal L7Ae/L30e/S12e/Gadd45 family protein [Alicyclobacillus sp. SO9]|uniref:ribosomal L7Ae/L30e/S12e/Gadd45 family protein n=1 Tax=Alicyclobacillus sp. SO9 TaxID=2665646 RepID=UPI0018E88A62|nr:ribosomal L7Ae/L30e/S12e/Gadd45 family protein [Alicyclobacillus sp. SO9]QQE78537.1 ribosomal L7Ae/L30e/S12e/Gadd45 family protein [Alicyclobacillus sp. SO9]